MVVNPAPPIKRRVPITGAEVAAWMSKQATQPRTVECEVCGNAFVARSHRARFCCAAHKQQAYRQRQATEATPTGGG
jgi:hypothetical protein